MESFFGSLKRERVHWRHDPARYEAPQDILHAIAQFYDSHPLHSSSGYQSPNRYVAKISQIQKDA